MTVRILESEFLRVQSIIAIDTKDSDSILGANDTATAKVAFSNYKQGDVVPWKDPIFSGYRAVLGESEGVDSFSYAVPFVYNQIVSSTGTCQPEDPSKINLTFKDLGRSRYLVTGYYNAKMKGGLETATINYYPFTYYYDQDSGDVVLYQEFKDGTIRFREDPIVGVNTFPDTKMASYFAGTTGFTDCILQTVNCAGLRAEQSAAVTAFFQAAQNAYDRKSLSYF